MTRTWLLVAVLATLTFLLDQVPKALVRGWPVGTRVSWVDGWLTLAHVENPAGLLGIGMDWPIGIRVGLFVVSAVGLIAVVAWWLRSLSPAHRLVPIAIGAILGGAAGNGLDRLVRGSVTDWIVAGETLFNPIFSAVRAGARTPAFNLADVWLGLGVALLALHVLLTLVRRSTGNSPSR